MELRPDDLRAEAHRWDACAAELGDALGLLAGAPVATLGGAAREADQLVRAAEDAVSRLRAEAERLVDGLLVTARSVTDVDEAVAAAVARLGSAG
ncbi:hypothetical protein [Nocardioides euryhalodurans]|uniref:Uncharacterized protein n=1 Tax=Nocardioides euryhalodurans TaxID=2518370 RepID=A0A4P7GPK4_9ACTN|nr:hypothetical protein [Nocardioides euryhalodurans]QBR93939.1 hypothetical protein EXE57_17855 [Nocardioides euryhalodurans]